MVNNYYGCLLLKNKIDTQIFPFLLSHPNNLGRSTANEHIFNDGLITNTFVFMTFLIEPSNSN